MGCYWTSFAAGGDPNTGACNKELRLPTWPVLGTEGDALELGNETIAERKALYKAECDLFAQYP